MSIFGKLLGVVTDTLGITDKGSVAVKNIMEAVAGNPALSQKLEELELQERRDIRDLYKVELGSSDKFVRRVRPAALWMGITIMGINFGLLPILNAILAGFGVEPVVLVYPELPEPIYWLITTIYLGYTGARTMDKKNGKK